MFVPLFVGQMAVIHGTVMDAIPNVIMGGLGILSVLRVDSMRLLRGISWTIPQMPVVIFWCLLILVLLHVILPIRGVEWVWGLPTLGPIQPTSR